VELGKETAKYLNILKEGVLLLNDRKEVVYHNRSAEKILGQKINLAQRVNIENILGGANQQFYEFLFTRYLGCEDTANHEISYRRGNRTLRLQISTCGVEDGNGRYGLMVAMNDITGLWKLHDREKKLQSHLLKNYADQMENLRQIARNVAHEIRNPLVSIGGYVNLLLKKHDLLKDRKEYKKYLGYISKDTERLHEIVKQVERYSDFTEIKFTRQNVARIFEDALKFAEKYARVRGINLKGRGPVNADFTVYVDSRKLRQGLRYLVKNAVHLASRTHPASIEYELSPFEAHLSIQLHTHLEKEEVPFLFNPFYSTRQRKLNFELATAQRIALLHGGIINAIWNDDGSLELLLSIPREKRLSRAQG